MTDQLQFTEQTYTQKLALDILKNKQNKNKRPESQSLILQQNTVELAPVEDPQLTLGYISNSNVPDGKDSKNESIKDELQNPRSLLANPEKLEAERAKDMQKLAHDELSKKITAGIISTRTGGDANDIGRLLFDAENRTDYRDAGFSMALGMVPVNELYEMKEKITAGRASGAYLGEEVDLEQGRNAIVGATHAVPAAETVEAEDLTNYAAFLPIKPYNPTQFEQIQVDDDAAVKQLLQSIIGSIPAEFATSFTKEFGTTLQSSSFIQLMDVKRVADLIVTADEPQEPQEQSFSAGNAQSECIYSDCMRRFLEKHGSSNMLSRDDLVITKLSRSFLDSELDNMLLSGQLKALQTITLKEAIDLMKKDETEPYKHKNTDVEVAYMASEFGSAIMKYIDACEEQVFAKRTELAAVFKEHKQNQAVFKQAQMATMRDRGSSTAMHSYTNLNDKEHRMANHLTRQQMQQALDQYDAEINRQIADGVEVPEWARKPSSFLDKKDYDPLEAVQRLTNLVDALARINDSDHLLSFFSEFHVANVEKSLDPRIATMVLREMASTRLFLHPLERREFEVAPLLDEVLAELDLAVTGDNPFKVSELKSYTRFLAEGVALPLGDNGTTAQLVRIWDALKMPIVERLDLFSVLSGKDMDLEKLQRMISFWEKEVLICNEIEEKHTFIQEFCDLLEKYQSNTASIQQLEARKTKLWGSFREIQRIGVSLKSLAIDAKQEIGMVLTYSGMSVDEFIKNIDKVVADCKANMPSNLFLNF